MEDNHKVLDLLKELVHRLLTTPSSHSDPQFSQNPNPNSLTTTTNPNSIDPNHQQALKYAIRILSSQMSPSIATDESAMAESIKRQLATQGKSSDALTFADLYSKFASKTGSGSVNNKWSVLYLLKVVFEDMKYRKMQSDPARVSNSFLSRLLDDELYGNGVSTVVNDVSRFQHNLGNSRVLNCNTRGNSDNSRYLRSEEGLEKGWKGGVLLVSKDPGNIRDLAYREFANLLREYNEVSEEVLMRDVLYACQGIDRRFVKFEESVGGYVLLDSVRASRATRIMVMNLCELGCLFRNVKARESVYCAESFCCLPILSFIPSILLTPRKN